MTGVQTCALPIFDGGGVKIKRRVFEHHVRLRVRKVEHRAGRDGTLEGGAHCLEGRGLARSGLGIP